MVELLQSPASRLTTKLPFERVKTAVQQITLRRFNEKILMQNLNDFHAGLSCWAVGAT
ncbi:MAG: hypothetical protein CLLPBCKN_005106 [Chroococcidiopsis cubana SAG 39.79]|jgi:hypothetical protein|uniref:Uncharacterized protein n=1 Tax=Chroococcidiopsis thermalis (strain PCC 7203) TaxID=251229 RepID=K9U832_CHRTP|nr:MULTISPECIES: hypothetical protein [Chroococcidiopsis]AFY90601.1 hypothetical protein Chro_5232 [Chroococcidiopsis thermalis PCC 7203]MDZ4875686.1 hypothetical protein [Chroococcidiopsis cubana SAG 39.79]URD50118.1 hypothetical protein M5J74_27935 [Chroococcidiopsis sp. CCNUC1]